MALPRHQNKRRSKSMLSIIRKPIQKYLASKVINLPHRYLSTDYVRGLSDEQINKIEVMNKKLRNRHNEIEGNLDTEGKDMARRKRMIYRSKQRGWLEADILMGSWAVQNVPKLNNDELDEYEIILNEETIDIFNFITGKDKLPKHLENSTLMKKIQKYAFEEKLTTPEEYAKIKKNANLT